MDSNVLLGLQMNAPPNETVQSYTASSTEREVAEGAKESPSSFRSLLAKRCHQADLASNDPPDERVSGDGVPLPASADSLVLSDLSKVEGGAIGLLMPAFPVLIDWGALNVSSQGSASTPLEDEGESWLQNLPSVDLDQGGVGNAPNIPARGETVPQPASVGTADNFAAEVAQAVTQDEGGEPQTLDGGDTQTSREFRPVPTKMPFFLQPEKGGVPERNNRLQQGIEIPESMPVSAHLKTASPGESAIFAPFVMGAAKARAVVTAEQLLPQTVRAVEMMVRLDQSNLHLQLYPESLGRIEVRIAHGTEGTHVWLVADQPQTERLLQAGLSDLRQSLTHAGIQLADVAVGGQNAHANLFRQPQGSPARLQVPLDAISPEVSTEGQAHPRIGMSDSYVDYRI